MTKRAVAIVELVLVMMVWGSAVVISKSAVTTISPMIFALLRFVMASALLLPLAIWRHRQQPTLLRGSWWRVATVGLLGVTVFYPLSNLALGYASATQGVIVQSSIPVFTAILAWLVLRERLGARQVGGIALSLVGVVIVVLLAQSSDSAPNPLLGSMLMLAGVLAWSVYTIVAKGLDQLDSLVVTGYSTAIGTLALLPLVFAEQWQQPWPTLAAGDWLTILFLGIVSSALGHLLYNRSLRELDASQVASYINLMPVIGVVLAMLILGEPLSGLQIVGGLLVLLGVWPASTTGQGVQQDRVQVIRHEESSDGVNP